MITILTDFALNNMLCPKFMYLSVFKLHCILNSLFLIFQTTWLTYANPTAGNKANIAKALYDTFQERRKWINTAQPSATEIVQKYKHLMSYGGDMVSSPIILYYF